MNEATLRAYREAEPVLERAAEVAERNRDHTLAYLLSLALQEMRNLKAMSAYQARNAKRSVRSSKQNRELFPSQAG